MNDLEYLDALDRAIHEARHAGWVLLWRLMLPASRQDIFRRLDLATSERVVVAEYRGVEIRWRRHLAPDAIILCSGRLD